VTTRVSPLVSPTAPVLAAAIIFTPLIGVALAVDLALGIALVVVICYLGIALVSLRAAVALWLPLIFLGALPAFNLAAEAAGLLLVVLWLGQLGHRDRAAAAAATVDRHRRLLEVLFLLLVWLALSALWAASSERVLADIWHWAALALLWLVLATTLDSRRSLRLAAAAFVAGAILSVAIGVASGALTDPATEERLEGAAGDPNFLAASLVPAIVLAAALVRGVRDPLLRGALVAAIPVLAAGLVLSQSRGGALAAVGTVLLALVAFRGRRWHVAAFALLAVGVAVVAFATTPAAWERLTTVDAGGSGRSSLWTVAWRVTSDEPLTGVGLDNFVVVAGDYVREPGALTRVRRIAEDPQFVHNLYLHVLAENGIVGLALYLVFIAGCLRAAWVAADRFAARGDPSMEVLARAVLVGTCGMLISAFFLSSMVDQRMWVLFALGPALLAAAGRAPAARG
jgi:O-antigen ligase